jgi:hypothetical protein
MKPAAILTVLLGSALAFGQKFDVSDVSATDSPISFGGTAKVSKSGTTCMITIHNNSTQSLLAVEITGEVTDPAGRMQPTGLRYDHFFKDAGIPSGEGFDVVGSDFFDSMKQGHEYVNGVEVKPQPPIKDLACHAEFKVLFIQFEDGSTWGDYQVRKDLLARREKNMAVLSHLVDAYNAGGDAAFASALDESDSRIMAYHLKGEAAYFKIAVIDLVRKKLAVARKRQASGIF